MSTSTTIQSAVQQYLDERRRLGFDLKSAELMRFARYADARDHRGPLTLELQLDWAREHVRRTGAATWARRLDAIRPFVAYYKQFEPSSVVPPRRIFGAGRRRLVPHIYTETEINDLIKAAGRLQPEQGLRPATYQTLFGLIASAGLRLSEALNLQVIDVDLAAGNLFVRQTKFSKSRRLPVHPSVVQALRRYEAARDCVVPRAAQMPFFVSPQGCKLPSRTVHSVFEGLRNLLGWQARGEHRQPRIHDLRHTFAVRRIVLWQASGVTMDHGIFWLCTYLGHAKISDTYWYLTGVPELMSVVGARFERFALGLEVPHG